MLAWVKMLLENHKAILSVVFILLGISGVSIYGNVNEFNPWRIEPEPKKEVSVTEPQITVIEKTIETRVESGITKKDITDFTAIIMKAHIEEFH